MRWVLYNSESKLQSIPVNHEEIQWTVMRMKQIDWTKYYIWRDGWQNWQQLDVYLKSNQKEIIVEFKKMDEEVGDDTETTATVRVDKFSIEETPDKTQFAYNVNANTITDTRKNKSGPSNPEPKSSSASQPEPKRKTVTLVEIKPKVSATVESKVKSGGKSIFDTDRPATKNTTFVDWDDQLAKLFVESAQDFSGDAFGPEAKLADGSSPISFKEEKLAKNNYANRAERHTLKIEVLFINSKGKTFKSFSRNISLSGTLIDEEIPMSFLGQKFEIVIINRFSKSTANSRLQLFAKCPVLSAPNRIQFLDVKDTQKTKLRTLLEQYLIDQKREMSRAS